MQENHEWLRTRPQFTWGSKNPCWLSNPIWDLQRKDVLKSKREFSLVFYARKWSDKIPTGGWNLNWSSFFRLLLTVILILILVNIANVTKLRMQFVQTKIYCIYSIFNDVYFIIKRSGPQLTRRKKTALDLKRTNYPKLETEMPLTRKWSNLSAKTEALSTLLWINACNQIILWVSNFQTWFPLSDHWPGTFAHAGAFCNQTSVAGKEICR